MQTMFRSMAAVLLGTLLVAMTGCATLPSPEAMKAAVVGYQVPKLPEPGKAIVYVVRPSSLGGLIRFNVFVDDQEAASEMGYTRAGQYIYFNVTPGTHSIMSKAENWADVTVKANAGDIVFIQQEPAMGLIMARNSIFTLEDYQGKYHVKTLTPGTILRTEKGQAEGTAAALPTPTAPATQIPVPGSASTVAPTATPATAATTTTSATTPATTATAQASSDRPLSADELIRHVGAVSAVNGQLSDGAKVQLEWTWGNGFAISTIEGRAESVSGTRSVEGNRLCLRPAPTGSGMTRMSGLQDLAARDCYFVVQTGAKSYAWKSQSGGSTGGAVLKYTLP